MISAIAPPVVALARRDAPDAPTHLAVVLAAETITAALNVARALPTAVLRLPLAISHTVPAEVARRDPLKTRPR